MAQDSAQFGHDTTAAEVVQGLNFEGKIVVITGTSAGLGTETAKAFLSIGATVVGVVRNVEKMAPIAEAIKTETGNDKLEIMQCDLAKLESIRAFGAAFREKYSKIDRLICNAGVMATDGRRETQNEGPDAVNFEFQFGVCHVGHFLLVGLLVDLMLDVEGGSRLVMLSSVGHKLGPVQFDDLGFENGEYNTWKAYGQAKTANILFAKGFNSRYAGRGALGFSLHPGGIQTELGREMNQDSIKLFVEMIQGDMSKMGSGFKTIPQGAATTCYVATSTNVGPEQGGCFFQDCNLVTEIWDGEYGEKFSAPSVAEYALSDENVQLLWTKSEEMVGLTYPAA